MINLIYDTIIVGGGISGLSAAIYASRKKMKFILIADKFGGQFLESGEVLNYPGIVKTTGYEFADIMKNQMKFNEINPIFDEVIDIKKVKKLFTVKTKQNNNGYKTKTIIMATGARPRKLNVPGEQEFSKKGVTYCSICDGPLFSGQDVAVIGSGNSALEAVDFLKDVVKKIYLLVLDDKFNAHEYLIDKLNKINNLKIIYNASTTEILGDGFVNGIKYIDTSKSKEIIKRLDVTGVIIEIGRVPNTEVFSNLVDLDKRGHIIIDCKTNTSVPGIFAAGDCASGEEYQYVIAAGQGVMALIKASRYITNMTN